MCRLKRGPESLPVNHLFLSITLLINLVLSVAVSRSGRGFLSELAPTGSFIQVNLLSELGMVVLGTIVFAILVYILLRTFNYQARIYQTLFALFGTGIIFVGLQLVVTTMMGSSSILLLVLTLISIGIWSIVVFGNILASALETTLGRGVLACIAISIVQSIIVFTLFGTSIEVPSPLPAS